MIYSTNTKTITNAGYRHSPRNMNTNPNMNTNYEYKNEFLPRNVLQMYSEI